MEKQRICQQCGISFPRRGHADKFCTMACYGQWQHEHPRVEKRQRLIVPCWTCGILIERVPSTLASHNFCGRACDRVWRQSGIMEGDKNPSWRGGHGDYRGPNWKQQRQKALERDGHVCLHCGSSHRLTVNHKIPFRLFSSYVQANDLSNLETLCHKCHSTADVAFYAKHPLLFAQPRFPDCSVIKECEICHQPFVAAARAQRCEACCTFQCAMCGTTFVSRKRRSVRFCSRACTTIFLKSKAIFPHKCLACGVSIASGRFYCRPCFLQDPALRVRPGRKPGRKPKGQNVA